jgi:hypothetical protein
VGVAVSQQTLVDERRAVVRIDAEDGDGEHGGDVFVGFKDPFGGLVPYWPIHRPPGAHIGHRQREAELAEAVAALMTAQVDLDKPRDGVVPLRPEVRTGMWDLSKVPGFVRDRPRGISLAR